MELFSGRIRRPAPKVVSEMLTSFMRHFSLRWPAQWLPRSLLYQNEVPQPHLSRFHLGLKIHLEQIEGRAWNQGDGPLGAVGGFESERLVASVLKIASEVNPQFRIAGGTRREPEAREQRPPGMPVVFMHHQID